MNRIDTENQWCLDRCWEVQNDPDDRLDLWGREHYKLCRLDEPTPTPTGWKLHGDLLPGNKIFGADGKIIRVVAINKIVYDSPCYEIEFDDGTKIQSGAEHLWMVERKTKKRVKGEKEKRLYRENVLLKSEQIFQHDHRDDNRLAIPVAAPLKLPEAKLPIHPYILGAWLGDGTSGSGDITCGDPELFDRIEANNYVLRKNKTPHRNARCHNIVDMRGKLRKLGLLNNKHIPMIYLRASYQQRLDLLRGLMDTDGHCNTRGTATFVSVKKELADGMVELLNTLGMKPRIRLHIGTYENEDYPYYQVSFQAYATVSPFYLPRKTARCKSGDRPTVRRFIVACRPCDPVPMRCIQVSSRDGLYLTSKSMIPTHNSTIITFALTIQDILKNPEITVGIFSHTRTIAKEFLKQIKREFENNGMLKMLFPDVLWGYPAKEAGQWSEDAGIIVRRKNNPKEATLEAWGLVDGMPTGKHFNLRIYDDVVTPTGVSTPEQILKTTEAWGMSDNLGAMGGKVRTIGTRYKLADTYAEMIKRGAVKPRIHPATHNGKIDGKPVFFTQEEWDRRKRKQTRKILASQYMQNPLAEETASFMSDWLRAYEIRPRTMNVYICVDPSKGKSADNDNTAFAVVGSAVGGAMYLLDGYCHRMGLTRRWTLLKHLYLKWSSMPGVQIVRVGYERYGAQTDDEYFQRQMEMKGEPKFVIEELNWVREGLNSKQDRVERLEPDFRNSRFYIPLAVWHQGEACVWKVDRDPDSQTYQQVTYAPVQSLTKAQLNVIQAGSPELVARALKRYDEESQIYDLTERFIDEYINFPSGEYKDLVDATSRIYDLEIRPPVIVSKRATEPNQYHDS